jgi:adenylate cyclase
MAQEIELKFLVKGDFRPFVTKKYEMVQAYLSTNPKRTVRIRIRDDKGFINIKGLAKVSGIMRFEWEKEIPLDEARELMELRESGLVEKTRYIVPANDGLVFEVDEFHGDNQGLLMAEIELPTTDTSFEKPDWLGDEVTGNPSFYSSELSKNPYRDWKELAG